MRVAVLGAGYAGVAVARRLEGSLDDEVDLVVVDETGTHLVQHELHRIVRRPSLAADLDLPLEDLLDEASVREDRVEDVDPDEGIVSFEDAEELSYDVGALCLGAQTAFHGIEGVREHATPLKTVADALAIRESFLRVCSADGHAVVGGAGLSGVQVAGEFAALADELDASPRITLLEQEERVAPRFPPGFGRAVRSALDSMGVEVRTGARVVGADDATIDLADDASLEAERSLDYDALVWTGGIQGSDALDADRPTVRADLRLGERTIGVGDAVTVVDDEGEVVPASAQAAVSQAGTAATNVRRLVEGGDGVFAPRLERFTFESPGWLVSVGDGAVAKIGPTVLTGAAANAVKATVGANYYTSVGAVRKASDLVYEELGLGDAEPPEEFDGARENGDPSGGNDGGSDDVDGRSGTDADHPGEDVDGSSGDGENGATEDGTA